MWNTIFLAIEAVVMPLSFFIVVGFGEKLFILPWFTSYFLLNTIYLLKTLKILQISITEYVRNLSSPLIGVLVMVLSIMLLQKYSNAALNQNNWIALISKIVTGGFGYIGLLYAADRKFLVKMRKIMSK